MASNRSFSSAVVMMLSLATARSASADEQLGVLADEQLSVLADKAGGTVTLQPVGKGKTLAVADGSTVTILPFESGGPEGAITVSVASAKGMKFFVPSQNLCRTEGAARADGAQFYACNESQGDLMHADIWFAPTLATRFKITDGGSEQEAFWAPTPQSPSVVVADETMYVIDPQSGAITKIESAGSPSWNSAGVLHYRTLDGGAWKRDGGKSVKLGKGKRGKRSSGDLNDGVEPTQWPARVTFGKGNKPKFK